MSWLKGSRAEVIVSGQGQAKVEDGGSVCNVPVWDRAVGSESDKNSQTPT